jgi:hypothetical protein
LKVKIIFGLKKIFYWIDLFFNERLRVNEQTMGGKQK